DLVHDTYLRAIRFRHNFQPGTNLKAWLFRIMINLFNTRYARNRRGLEIVEGGERHDVVDVCYDPATLSGSRNPEEFFFEKLFSQDVIQAVDKLPVEFRLAVLLVDMEGFSYAETASVLGIPVGTVMSRLFRGRKMLRQLLYRFAVEHGYVRSEKTLENSGEVAELDEYRKHRSKGRKG
ncbi:MAG: sigma-70 family RNA polymerase sigma factor, partial [Deltaproteobacteria bacterium]